MTLKDKIMALPVHSTYCTPICVDKAEVLKIVAEQDALLHRTFMALRRVSRCATIQVAPLIEATCISEDWKKEIAELAEELEKV